MRALPSTFGIGRWSKEPDVPGLLGHTDDAIGDQFALFVGDAVIVGEGDDLGDGCVAVADGDGLSGLGVGEVLAELVLEDCDVHGSHGVASIWLL